LADLLARVKTALVDRYAVEREIGRGGMARVFLATELHPRRQVAIKVLDPDVAAALGPERFLREVDLASKLTYPHILSIFAAGEAEGLLYYAMPYVAGESLRERIEREKQLPVADALQIAREVAGALGYAHMHGIIHRDIKPENILLESGHAMVADFGIARAISAAGGDRLTETGIAVGTPAYMSPEQSLGERAVDARADIYALGCVLYEMLAGVPPISGSTAQAIVARRLSEAPPSIRTVRDAVPEPVERATLKALARVPADRFASVEQFAEALHAASAGAPGGAARHPLLLRPVAWLGLAVALAVALIPLVLRGHRGEIRLGSRTHLTLQPGLEVDPAVSPDGRFVAYAAGPLSEARIYVLQVEGGGSPVAVAKDFPGWQRFPYWSPDGGRLLFLSARGIEVVAALGGVPRLLVPTGGAFALAGPWSPDGKQIAFARSDSLFVAPVNGGSPKLLDHHGDLHSFSWSPDGRWIAEVRGNRQSIDPKATWFYGNFAQSAVWLVPTVGGLPVRVTDDRFLHASPVWMPGARDLLFLSNAEGGPDLYRVKIGHSGQALSAPERLTTGLNARAVSVSADGRRVAYCTFSETSNVWDVPIPSGAPALVSRAQPVTSGDQVVESFDVSPDGRWLAFDSDRSGTVHIYRMPLGGGQAEQLTTDSAAHFWPRWSPDGREIAFHSFRNGRRRLFLMSADGHDPVAITRGDDDERTGEWRRDGRAVYYLYRYDTSEPEIRLVERNDAGAWGAPRSFRHLDALPAVPSPDGHHIAYASSEGLYYATLAGDSSRILVPGSYRSARLRPTYLGWSADGRALYYLALDSVSRASIWSINPDGGGPRLLVRFDDPSRQWHRYGFTAYGGRFYFTLGDRQSDIWSMTVAVGR
jgi:serine/threonine-protein kinase